MAAIVEPQRRPGDASRVASLGASAPRARDRQREAERERDGVPRFAPVPAARTAALPVLAAGHLLEGKAAPVDGCDAGDVVVLATRDGQLRAFRTSPFTAMVASFSTLAKAVTHVRHCARSDALVTLERTDFGSSINTYHAWRAPWRHAATDGNGRGGRGPVALRVREGPGTATGDVDSVVVAHTMPLAAAAEAISVCAHTGRVAVAFAGTIGVWLISPNSRAGGPLEHVLEVEARPLLRSPITALALAQQYLLVAQAEDARVIWMDVHHAGAGGRAPADAGAHSRLRVLSAGGADADAPLSELGDGDVDGGSARTDASGAFTADSLTELSSRGPSASPAALAARAGALRQRQLVAPRSAATRANWVDYEAHVPSASDAGAAAGAADTADTAAAAELSSEAGASGAGGDGGRGALPSPSTGAAVDDAQVLRWALDADGLPADVNSVNLVTDVGIGVRATGYPRRPGRSFDVLGPIAAVGLLLRPNAATGFTAGTRCGAQLLLRRAFDAHEPLHTAAFAPASTDALAGGAADARGALCCLLASRGAGHMYVLRHGAPAAPPAAAPADGGADDAGQGAGPDGAVGAVGGLARPRVVASYRWQSETTQVAMGDALLFALTRAGEVEVWTRWSATSAALSPSETFTPVLLAVQSLVGPELPLSYAPRALLAARSGALLMLPPEATAVHAPEDYVAHRLQLVHKALPPAELEMRFAGGGEADDGDDDDDDDGDVWE